MKTKRQTYKILFLVTCTAILMLQATGLIALPAWAEPGRIQDGQAVMVVIDRIVWEDIIRSDVPVLKKLAVQGAVGLMTTTPAGGSSRIPDNTYATIGAGAKISGGILGGAGFNAGERYENGTAAEAYYRYTGERPSGAVVYLGLGEMAKANRANTYEFVAGAVGTVLHQNGRRTAVLGNADMPGLKKSEECRRRQVVTLAMDSKGQVDFGDVSERTYKYDPHSLAGVKTDYAYLLNEFAGLKGRADFVVVETGDMSRINESSHVVLDEVAARERQRVLAEIDRFLGRLLSEMDLQKDLLMIVVPGPPTWAMEQGRFLTPFIMAGKGVSPGLAWSGSVKRPGLITNIDIAVQIIRYFGVPAVVKASSGRQEAILGGQLIESRKTAAPFNEIRRLDEDTVFLYNARYPLVKGYVNTELAAVVLFMVLALLKKPAPRWLVPLFVAFTAVPAVMLWANYLSHPHLIVLLTEIVAISAAVALVALRTARRRVLGAFAVTAGLTVLLIVADIFAGAPLAKTSPFSYDVMSGARFYGLGNEYMGVLIGCVIVLAGFALDLVPVSPGFLRAGILAVFVVVVYTIAAPGLGTNVGGTIASVAGLGVTTVVLFGGRVSKTAALSVFAAAVVILAAFMAYDLSRPVEVQSHIGRTVTLIREGGLGEVGGIIARKWAMNFGLVKNSSWSWFYGICLLGLLFAGRLMPGPDSFVSRCYPWFKRIIPGVITGSVFAFLFNDSGIVAASTMIIYAVAPYLAGLVCGHYRDACE